MIYFLAWLLIIPVIYLAAKLLGEAMDWSDGALCAAVAMPVVLIATGACLMIGIWPFYMNSDVHHRGITLDATAWGCAKSETVIEPVHHMVGKIIVTRNEPVTECLQYSRVNIAP